jgi:hypothetical protein
MNKTYLNNKLKKNKEKRQRTEPLDFKAPNRPIDRKKSIIFRSTIPKTEHLNIMLWDDKLYPIIFVLNSSQTTSLKKKK